MDTKIRPPIPTSEEFVEHVRSLRDAHYIPRRISDKERDEWYRTGVPPGDAVPIPKKNPPPSDQLREGKAEALTTK